MELMFQIFLLVAGFVLLIKGADFFVEGSSSVAKILKVPSIIVGLTIVSMGTSLPEMAVSISAAIRGENAIAVSNVVGSNFFNLLVVLGACALIKPIAVHASIIKREYPINIVITGVLAIFSADLLLSGKIGQVSPLKDGELQTGMLSRLDGIVLLAAFVLFLVMSVISALRARKEWEDDVDEKPMTILQSLLCIVGGIAAIAVGGDVVVQSAQYIAAVCGMSDTLIGLTIVAMGTSLPELVTSLVASKKGENDLAVGNVIGSNLFNILFVLGISSTITPIAVTLFSVIDMVLLFAVTIITYLFVLSKKSFSRREGLIMLVTYAAYMGYIIMR